MTALNSEISRDRIWRPFTQMLNAEAPLMVRRGYNEFLELEDGRKIVDCISSWWVTLHGHAQKEIADAIAEQAHKLEQVIFAGFTHEPAEQFVEMLLPLLPKNLQHLFFSDNGSTAVEVSLKLAFQYWLNQGENRTKFIAFEGGYHGDTAGAMSIGQGSPFWKTFEPLLFSIQLAPFPATFDEDPERARKEEESIAAVRKILEEGCSNIAAICIEPLIQGAGGMRFCSPEFLQSLRKLANEYQTLLIFDEVMTGFGRTGEFFASLKSSVSPDIICLSKGISGGFLPLSATVCSSKVYDAFLSEDHSKTFFHGHSYTANPIACAAAIASLKLLKNSAAFRQLELRHKKLADKYLKSSSNLINFRICGTIFACEYQNSEGDSYFNSVAKTMKKCFIESGFLIRPLGNTIYLMPPYCISEESLEHAYKTIYDVCESL